MVGCLCIGPFNLINYAKQWATNHLKLLQKDWLAKATGELIGNKIIDKITIYNYNYNLKNSSQNTSVTVEGKTEMPKERHAQKKGSKLLIKK